eukprot:4767969-Prymnesium_polylepis.1
MHSGQWAEAALLFRPNLAPNWKMLPSRRHRAGALDVGRLPTGRAFVLWPPRHRGAKFCAEARCRGVHKHSETCRSSRPAQAISRSSHGW